MRTHETKRNLPPDLYTVCDEIQGRDVKNRCHKRQSSLECTEEGNLVGVQIQELSHTQMTAKITRMLSIAH